MSASPKTTIQTKQANPSLLGPVTAPVSGAEPPAVSNQDHLLTVAEFNSKTDNRPKAAQVNWGEFLARVRQPLIRASEDGAAYSFAIFSEPRRKNEFVEAHTAVVLDLDHGLTFAEAESLARATGYECVLHTTHSHRRVTKENPQGEDRARVIFPLKTPVLARFVNDVRQIVKGWFNGLSDANTDDLAHLFFKPSKVSTDAPYEFSTASGQLLDWAALGISAYWRSENGDWPVRLIGEYETSENQERAMRVTWLDREGEDQVEVERESCAELPRLLSVAKVEAEYRAAAVPIHTNGKTAQGNGATAKPVIDATAIRQSVAKTLKPKKPATHASVFSTILKKLPKFEKDASLEFFKEKAGIEPDKNPSQRDYIVVTIEQILETAEVVGAGVCRVDDFIYVYNGQFWKQCEQDELERFLGEAAEKLGVPAMAARYCRTRKILVEQFRSAAYMSKPERTEGVTLLNFTNGTFEVTAKSQQLRPFRREDFLTYQLPFAYDPTAAAPKWTKYLDEVLPAESKDLPGIKSRQLVLAEFVAWCFAEIKLERILFLYGEGANGKSVFFEVISALLGEENVTHYSLASLSDSKGYERAKIANSLLNYASEIGVKVDAEYLKKLASREPVEARLPYGQPFMLKHYARLAFNANELPRDAEHSTAFFRRFLVVPFDVTIPPEKRNKNLHAEIIKIELSGVFNWVLAGLQRLLQQKDFSKCDAAEKAQEQFQYESDSVALFIDECGYRRGKDDIESKKLTALYSAYRSFAKEAGFYPLSSVKFAKRLTKLGFQSVKRMDGKHVFITREEAEKN